jgi:hypothetical protein
MFIVELSNPAYDPGSSTKGAEHCAYIIEDLPDFPVELLWPLLEPYAQQHAGLHGCILAEILHFIIEGGADHIVLIPRNRTSRSAIVRIRQEVLKPRNVFS